MRDEYKTIAEIAVIAEIARNRENKFLTADRRGSTRILKITV